MSTLLERLSGQRAVGSSGPAALRDSVLNHLRDMCRTRRGTMHARPDYGLPEISEMVHSFPGAITAIREALQSTVEKYEPRLRGARVVHTPSTSLELYVRFEITGTLVDAGGTKYPVRFETRVDASRAVTIE